MYTNLHSLYYFGVTVVEVGHLLGVSVVVELFTTLVPRPRRSAE